MYSANDSDSGIGSSSSFEPCTCIWVASWILRSTSSRVAPVAMQPNRSGRYAVYLPEDLDAALKRAAGSQGQSEAEIIREAIRNSLDSMQQPRPRLPLFRSSNSTLAERVDEGLTSFGG